MRSLMALSYGRSNYPSRAEECVRRAFNFLKNLPPTYFLPSTHFVRGGRLRGGIFEHTHRYLTKRQGGLYNSNYDVPRGKKGEDIWII